MASDVVQQIRKVTRRKYTAEQKIKVVVEGLRGEIPVAELCRREGLSPATYYQWSKAFLEAGKNGLTKDTRRDATRPVMRSKPSSKRTAS
jgi:transposase